MACEHEYMFQGAVCFSSKRTIPGSGAREMIYYDRYYCKKCLDIQDRNKRVIGNSYEGDAEWDEPPPPLERMDKPQEEWYSTLAKWGKPFTVWLGLVTAQGREEGNGLCGAAEDCQGCGWCLEDREAAQGREVKE